MTDVVVEQRAGNLPADVTRFIGRRRELGEAKQVLERSRLVTLYGTGGVGKTRLALRLATDLRRSFADGAWLVELSALRSPELLARAVADALRLPDQAVEDPVDLLADHLAGRHLLLILDTCEHLVDACAMLAEVLLRAAPRLHILATSREPLEVMGEYTLQVPPLEAADSAQLFADRAAAIVPGFVPGESVSRLCHRLDGIPLAIELAAVRLRALSVDQIVTRLDDRFRLLGTARSRHDRHTTLRGAVAWSHDLCTTAEQRLWARLSVFPGDFDLDAAEQVADGDFDVLTRLVEKSVVLCDPESGRFRMLDTIREFGAEQADADLRVRHRDYYLRLAERAAEASVTPEQPAWLARLRAENANLRAALEFSLSTQGEEPAGLRLTVALTSYWLCVGQLNEARMWFGRAIESGGDRSDVGWAAGAAGMLAVLQGDVPTAEAMLGRAAEIAEELSDADLRAHVITSQARGVLYAGDLAGARAQHEEAQRIFDEIGYSSPFAMLNNSLIGAVCGFAGDPAGGLVFAERAIRICEAAGEQWAYSFGLYLRAVCHWMLGDVDTALPDLRRALRIKEGLGDLFGLTICTDLFIACAITLGEYERGATLTGASDALWRMLGVPIQLGPQYL